MALSIDYYELLEISRDASGEDIKRAFRKKVRLCHPDRCPGDTEAEAKFKQINEAYSVLVDPQKRAHYDRYGTAEAPAGGMSDLFSGLRDLFGAWGEDVMAGDGPGPDITLGVSLTLEEAAKGCQKKLTWRRVAPCDHCGGSGAAQGSEPRACSTCGGTGRVHRRQRSLFGTFNVEELCPVCGGRGTVHSRPCTHCKGEGLQEREEERTVDIPAGIQPGTALRIEGAGHWATPHGGGGDLLLHLSLRPHGRFACSWPHLGLVQDVDLWTAVSGGPVRVDTLVDGPKTVTVDPGLQSGSTVTLKGLGMPVYGAKVRGDLTVQFRVPIPKPEELTALQIEALRQAFAPHSVFTAPEEKKEEEGLFDRLKRKAKEKKGRGKRAKKTED